jgi:hypothetical protein
MRPIRINSADQTFFVLATDGLTGVPTAGLTPGDVAIRYIRTRAAPVQVPVIGLPDPSVHHVDGGWCEIDGAACPGWYRVDFPDAAFAEGVDAVLLLCTSEAVQITAVAVRLVSHDESDLYAEAHLARAMLANRRTHTVSTGINVVYDDNGTTPLRTLTPQSDGDDVITIEPS